MVERLFFISMIAGGMIFLIYFARYRLSALELIGSQRDELVALAGVIRGIESNVEINEGD